MTEENKSAAVEAEWSRSDDALRSAEILAREGQAADAISRAYYAMYHAAAALLFSVGLQPRTHQGVRTLVSLHFVKSGRLEPRLAQLFSQASRSREDADYATISLFSTADAAEWLAKAREFRAAGRAILEADGWLPQA